MKKNQSLLILLIFIIGFACQPTREELDTGTVVNRTYNNSTLRWTFKIPKNYDVELEQKVESYYEKGAEALNAKQNDTGTTKLLNISTDSVGMLSNVSLRSAFPKLDNEREYLNLILKKYKQAEKTKIDSISFGTLRIDEVLFHKLQIRLTFQKKNKNIIILTRIGENHIFDIAITHNNKRKAKELINSLQKSQLKWY